MEITTHKITDMYLVAALFAYGAEYIGVDRVDKRNQVFLFREPLGIDLIHVYKRGIVDDIANPTFEELKSAYDTVSLLYPPNYVEALRRVKGIIHT